ncbi:copper chaperone PCu(A)C [Halodurantibacterium flavum]|uniref:Copper chaperone PCu(A)C n=1 Tax=Halodurantibacterium flavum TaxID=1382802 RepID=A0ABW4S7H7_9RHOB
MFPKLAHLAAVAALALPITAPAVLAHDGMAVRDAYARVTMPTAPTAAAFMVIENHRAIDDRLIAVRSDAAERVELHTHQQDDAGVMRMIELEDGIAIHAGGEHALVRGGDHLMFLGLTRPLSDGDIVHVTLTFEQSGDLEVEIPVDLNRAEDAAPHDHGAGHGHSGGHSSGTSHSH